MPQRRPRAAFAMRSRTLLDALFSSQMQDELRALLDLDPVVVTDLSDPGVRDRLAGTELLITGWGAPFLDADLLERMPRLRAIVHLGGTARWFLGDSPVLSRIAASNAGHVNSIPVAQFSLALILLSGKNAIRIAADYRSNQSSIDRESLLLASGNHGRTIGIVGASRVGRLLIEMLTPHAFTVLVHDPYLSDAEAEALGVRTVALDELLERSDVISLHVPSMPSTRGMIGARELALIRGGGTLINTARGAIVDQHALLRELRIGRLNAYLDTTDPEILPDGHELYELPNVFLTPHIAGSTGNELHRLGASALSEVRRFVAGAPFDHPETLSTATADTPTAPPAGRISAPLLIQRNSA